MLFFRLAPSLFRFLPAHTHTQAEHFMLMAVSSLMSVERVEESLRE
nr:MAG TPA: hypothetical protein [Herelleviridae sp.]